MDQAQFSSCPFLPKPNARSAVSEAAGRVRAMSGWNWPSLWGGAASNALNRWKPSCLRPVSSVTMGFLREGTVEMLKAVAPDVAYGSCPVISPMPESRHWTAASGADVGRVG